VNYQLIVGHPYRLPIDVILCWYVLDHEWYTILWEVHEGNSRGNYGEKETIREVLKHGLWWMELFTGAKEYE